MVNQDVTLFGRFGNQARRFANNPSVRPDSRRFVDYDVERKLYAPAPVSVFTPEGMKSIEPSGFSFDLSVAQTDFEVVISGNFIFYMGSTNVSDLVRVKYERKSSFAFPYRPGNKVDGIPFTRLYFSWLVIAGATAEFMILSAPPSQPVTVL